MKANLAWLAVMSAACALAWFAPHQAFAPMLVAWAWVFGTWWGYFTAQGERE